MKSIIQIRPLIAVAVLVLAAVGGGLIAGYLNGGHPAQLATVAASTVRSEDLVTFAPVVKKATPAVVSITSTKVIKAQRQMNPFFNDPFFRQFFGNENPMGQPRDRREQGLGSGVIVNPNGYILTNNHVVDGANDVRVLLSDKREFKAKVVGTDSQTDVAVLKIEAHDLPTLAFSDSSKAEVGDVCLAIGNPFGIGETVTMGIVGATGRNGLGIEDYEQFIQTDAAINPGNSGGALINTHGQLIGINTAILSGSGGNQGIGFAIPINLAANVMHEIENKGKVTRGYLGAGVQEVDANLAKAFHLPENTGVALTEIQSDTPASRAGLKSGDVVVELNGNPVKDVNLFRFKIAELGPGGKANLKVYRDGKSMDFTVTLAERPADLSARNGKSGGEEGTKSALEGVSVQALTPDIARELKLDSNVKGVVVTDVDESSAAAAAGLQRGDVILEVNRQPVQSVDEFQHAVSKNATSTLLRVNRNGGTIFIAIESK